MLLTSDTARAVIDLACGGRLASQSASFPKRLTDAPWPHDPLAAPRNKDRATDTCHPALRDAMPDRDKSACAAGERGPARRLRRAPAPC